MSSQPKAYCITTNVDPDGLSSEYVKELYDISRKAFIQWKESGSPDSGQLFDRKKIAKSRVKYAIRYINKHVDNLRKQSLANTLLKTDCRNFWKEIRSLNKSSVSLPLTIDGISGVHNITNMWKQHYEALFNSVSSSDDWPALKANYSDFLLSQYVIKLLLHSVLLFFSNGGDL